MTIYDVGIDALHGGPAGRAAQRFGPPRDAHHHQPVAAAEQQLPR